MGFLERPGGQHGWSTEHNGRVMGDGIDKDFCRRFEFYFHETLFEGSVSTLKCLNHLNSSDHFTGLVCLESDQQII